MKNTALRVTPVEQLQLLDTSAPPARHVGPRDPRNPDDEALDEAYYQEAREQCEE